MVTKVLADVMLGVGMSSGMEIIVMVPPAVTLAFVVGLAYAKDLMADLLTIITIDVVSAIGVDMLADEKVDGLAAAMTPLEFALPSP